MFLSMDFPCTILVRRHSAVSATSCPAEARRVRLGVSLGVNGVYFHSQGENGLNSISSHGAWYSTVPRRRGSVRRDADQCHRDDNAPHLRIVIWQHTLNRSQLHCTARGGHRPGQPGELGGRTLDVIIERPHLSAPNIQFSRRPLCLFYSSQVLASLQPLSPSPAFSRPAACFS